MEGDSSLFFLTTFKVSLNDAGGEVFIRRAIRVLDSNGAKSLGMSVGCFTGKRNLQSCFLVGLEINLAIVRKGGVAKAAAP